MQIYITFSTAAKNYIMKVMREAIKLPVDIGTASDIEQTIPKWIDADKCKRYNDRAQAQIAINPNASENLFWFLG